MDNNWGNDREKADFVGKEFFPSKVNSINQALKYIIHGLEYIFHALVFIFQGLVYRMQKEKRGL